MREAKGNEGQLPALPHPKPAKVRHSTNPLRGRVAWGDVEEYW